MYTINSDKIKNIHISIFDRMPGRYFAEVPIKESTAKKKQLIIMIFIYISIVLQIRISDYDIAPNYSINTKYSNEDQPSHQLII